MLTQLSVRNFTLVKALEIDFSKGMTAITGETGAGKSILLNALGLTLGDRADYGQIRQGEERAEVHAAFDISDHKSVAAFLAEQELEDADECLLRRVINVNGSSKAWINGQPVTLSTLRQLAQLLISIHSQHEHQRLTRKEQQLDILDGYAGHTQLIEATAASFGEWKTFENQLRVFEENQQEIVERKDLLRFQVAELDELTLQPGEYETLVSEQHALANAEEILNSLQQLSMLVSENDEFNLTTAINQAEHLAQSIDAQVPTLEESRELLSNARIHLDEARDAVRRAKDSVEMNPERLAQVEARLSSAYELSRKHRVPPEELNELHQKLASELNELESNSDNLDELRGKVAELETKYQESANALNHSRTSFAETLCARVNQYFEQLSMSGAELSIQLEQTAPNTNGGVSIDFLVRTNPGAPLKPIGKIASGGELSRISLAIQVVTAQTTDSPTLVFDEVDVGIGGATAAVVGELLRKLGEHAQVICVTHLAQVASQAHQQMGVAKQSDTEQTETSIHRLDQPERVKEIARMVGGAELTDQSIAHAEGLLKIG